MNILIIAGVFPPEPVTSACMDYDLASLLSKSHNVTVLRPYPSRPAGVVYKDSCDRYPFTCVTLDSYTCPESRLFGRLRESFSFGAHCAKYIKRHHSEIDVVYNDSWALFGYYLSARACVKYNIPYITPIQDIYPESLFSNKSWPKFLVKMAHYTLGYIDRYNQKHANKVRTISDEMADYLATTRGVHRDNYLVLDNWQNDEDFTYVPIKSKKVIFGYVGSINAHSNTELIIKAFASAKIENSELRIFGGGNHKDACVDLVNELGLKNVCFDIVDKKQVPTVQSAVSVLVLALPKGNGGLCLPSKMTSYMLSGRAILASVERSATTRYIDEAECGISVEPDNVEMLADAFRRFSKMDNVELNRLGANSRKFAEEHLIKSAILPVISNALISVK